MKYIYRSQKQNFVVYLAEKFDRLFHKRVWSFVSLWEFHILTILFCLLAYFDQQFIIYRNKTFNRMSVIFAKFKARNLVVLKTVNHRHCWLKDFVLKMTSSRIKRSCFFLFVDFASVNFTSFVTMKIKYYVMNRVWVNT